MSLLKLQPGQRIAFLVQKAESTTGQYGPQVKFIGQTDTDSAAEILLKVDTANKQLDRIGLNVLSVVGQSVEFEKVAKDGKQFINIYKGTNGAPKPTAAPSTEKQGFSSGPALPGETADVAPESTTTPEMQRLLAIYGTCWQHAHMLAYKDLGDDESHDATAAMAATMFIAAVNNRFHV